MIIVYIATILFLRNMNSFYNNIIIIILSTGESCTEGFLSTVSECINGCYTGSTETFTKVTPEMWFTCSGTVMHWRVAGRFMGGSRNAVFGIWRERSNELGTYDRVATIELGTCGSGDRASPVTGLRDVYECTLPESSRVSVQPGDIVGIEIPGRSELGFGLLFDNSNSATRPTQYEFSGQVSTVTLSQRRNTSPGDEPQISLTVEEVAPTNEALTTTLQATTEAPTTTISTQILTTDTNVHFSTTPPDNLAQTKTFVPMKGPLPMSLIVGAIAGGFALLVLFLAITLVLVYVTRKRKISDSELSGREKRSERKKKVASESDKSMEYNGAYVNYKIPTKENIAYGEVEKIDELENNYESIGTLANHQFSETTEPNIYYSVIS